MERSKAVNPSDPNRRPGGRGRRTGEVKAQRAKAHGWTEGFKEGATWEPAQKRIKVLVQPLWEKQPGETARAYERFRTYRDIGYMRTLKKASELEERAGMPASPNALAELSSKYRWQERVTAFDAYFEAVLLGQREKEIRERVGAWVTRQEEIREREFQLAMGLADKVAEMLRYPIKRIRRERVVTRDDGVHVHVMHVEPARWDWKAAADILDRIGYRARIAAEMVTDGARQPTPELTDRAMADIDAWLADIGVGDGKEA